MFQIFPYFFYSEYIQKKPKIARVLDRRVGGVREKIAFGPNYAVDWLTGRTTNCAYWETLWHRFKCAVVALSHTLQS